MDILKQSKITITRYQLFQKGDHILTAVSGGPDSMALLNILLSLRYEWGLRLSVVHVNHHLRHSAQTEEDFVRDYCHSRKIPFTAVSVHIRPVKGKSSLEERAREARLRALVRIAKKQKINIIALGHHQDDLAETVLMRLIRGVGLLGLRGILPKRPWQGISFVRPLFDVNRDDILDFLKKGRIPSCQDAMNFDRAFLRNKIRLELLPLLKKNYQANISETLAHVAKNVGYDYDYLLQQAQAALNRMAPKGPQHRLSLPVKMIRKEHPAIQRLVLRCAIEQIQGHLLRLTSNHLDDICDLLSDPGAQGTLHLPRGLIVKIKAGSLILSRTSSQK